MSKSSLDDISSFFLNFASLMPVLARLFLFDDCVSCEAEFTVAEEDALLDDGGGVLHKGADAGDGTLDDKAGRHGKGSFAEVSVASGSPLESCVGKMILLDVSRLENLSFRKRRLSKYLHFRRV